MSGRCQTGARQKLDAKFKQGSKLNFNKTLTASSHTMPGWVRQCGCHLTPTCNLKIFQGYKGIYSELYAWPRAIVKLIGLSGVTNKPNSYKLLWRCDAVTWVCHVTLSWCHDVMMLWCQTLCSPCHGGTHIESVDIL